MVKSEVSAEFWKKNAKFHCKFAAPVHVPRAGSGAVSK